MKIFFLSLILSVCALTNAFHETSIQSLMSFAEHHLRQINSSLDTRDFQAVSYLRLKKTELFLHHLVIQLDFIESRNGTAILSTPEFKSRFENVAKQIQMSCSAIINAYFYRASRSNGLDDNAIYESHVLPNFEFHLHQYEVARHNWDIILEDLSKAMSSRSIDVFKAYLGKHIEIYNKSLKELDKSLDLEHNTGRVWT